MKAILILVLLATTAAAEPVATSPVAIARAKWDAAVAGGHPVEAGVWARRHFAAMQQARAAERHAQQASQPVRGHVKVRSALPVRTRL